MRFSRNHGWGESVRVNRSCELRYPGAVFIQRRYRFRTGRTKKSTIASFQGQVLLWPANLELKDI